MAASDWGWKPPKVTAKPKKAPNPYASSGGGVAFHPPNPLGATNTDLVTGPPAFTFDPAIEAKRRQAQRGLEDTLENTATERHFAETDWKQAKHDITRDTKQKRYGMNRDFGRANERLGDQEADTQQRARRTREDLNTQLQNIGRQFADLGQKQGEAQNAAGVLDQGTSSAAAAARARNQLAAEAPIHTAEGRLDEDLASALERIGRSRGQLATDHTVGLNQLALSRDRQRLGANREHGRKEFGFGRTEDRAKREGIFTDADLVQSEIYEALNNHPGAFKKWAQENPGLLPEELQGKYGGTTTKQPPKKKNPNPGGGVTAPNKKGRR